MTNWAASTKEAHAALEGVLPPRFTNVLPLGRGGVGIVYQAYDQVTGTRVAVKTLRAVGSTALSRLKNEFRSLQGVQLPNLVQLGELLEHEGQLFFTMELVPGTDFITHVRGAEPAPVGSGVTASLDDAVLPLAPEPARARHERGECDIPRLRRALAQLARGLHALHGAGKVHRDIKPSNVLVTAEGRLAVLDFGLVTDVGVGSSGRQIAGTLGYMAPEQERGEVAGSEADLFSVGVVLFQALTGQLPTPKKNLADLPRRPSEIAPQVPPDLDALCVDLLGAEPQSRPTTRAILDRLAERKSVRAPSLNAPPRLPFLGRDDELRWLTEAFDHAAGGRSVTARVQGESGVGKSGLLRQFAEDVQRGSSAVVLSGRCYERESVPYKGVDVIMEALAENLRGRPPGEIRALPRQALRLLARAFEGMAVLAGSEGAPERDVVPDEDNERSRIFEAARALLTFVAQRSPTAILVDDAQWADEDSIALLEHVMRPPDAPPLLLVLAARPGSRGERRAGTRGEVRTLDIEALPLGAATELAARLLGDAGRDTSEAATFARRTNGHPLHLQEMVRLSADKGHDGSDCRLDDAISLRIARLDPQTRALLDVIVLGHGPLASRAAGIAAGLDDDEAQRSEAVLRIAGLAQRTLAHGRDAFEVYHDRVREVASGLLDEAARTSGHARLARVLAESPKPDPEAIALHCARAGAASDALAWARRGAARAERAYAFDRAASMWRLAREQAAVVGVGAHGISRCMADALANAGRGADAARAYLDAAAETTEPAARATLKRRAAEELLHAGRFDEGIDVLRDVLAAVGLRLTRTPRGAVVALLAARARLIARGMGFRERAESTLDPSDLARVDATRAVARGLGMFDNVRGAHFETLQMLYALEVGEPRRVAQALTAEAPFLAAAGHSSRARAIVQQASAMAQTLGDPQLVGMTAFAAGFSGLQEGRFRNGRTFLDRADGIFETRCTGVRWERITSQVGAMWCLAYMGELEELGRRLPSRLREAFDRGDVAAATNFRVGMPSFAWLARDEPDSAHEEAQAAISAWSQRGYHAPHCFSLMAHVNADLYAGDAVAAEGRLRREWPQLASSMFLRNQLIRITMTHQRGAVAVAMIAQGRGDLSAHRAEAARSVRKLSGEGVLWSSPLARLLDAALHLDRGDLRGAKGNLAAAALAFEEADMMLHAAAARFRLGALEVGGASTQLIEAAEAPFRAQRVRRTEAFVGMLAPGLGPRR